MRLIVGQLLIKAGRGDAHFAPWDLAETLFTKETIVFNGLS